MTSSRKTPGAHATWLARRLLPTMCPNCCTSYETPAFGNEWVPWIVRDEERRCDDGPLSLEYRVGEFVRCAICGNAGFRLVLGQRLLATRDEAERVCREEGFTQIVEMETCAQDLDAYLSEVNAVEAKTSAARAKVLFT